MHKYSYIISLVCLLAWAAGGNAQSLNDDIYATPEDIQPANTVQDEIQEVYTVAPAETVITTDTIIAGTEAENELAADSTAGKGKFKPDPDRVVWWGAIIPGYGQIVNKKYWKLPIVYGGFMGCAFAVSYFSNQYQTYRLAYGDIMDTDPATNSYIEVMKSLGVTYEAYGHDKTVSVLKSRQDNSLRYRDLSVLVTVVYYGLTILEAYVDAQLFDYDISPDLALRVQPTLINNQFDFNKPVVSPQGLGHSNAVGVQFNFRLK